MLKNLFGGGPEPFLLKWLKNLVIRFGGPTNIDKRENQFCLGGTRATMAKEKKMTSLLPRAPAFDPTDILVTSPVSQGEQKIYVTLESMDMALSMTDPSYKIKKSKTLESEPSFKEHPGVDMVKIKIFNFTESERRFTLCLRPELKLYLPFRYAYIHTEFLHRQGMGFSTVLVIYSMINLTFFNSKYLS